MQQNSWLTTASLTLVIRSSGEPIATAQPTTASRDIDGVAQSASRDIDGVAQSTTASRGIGGVAHWKRHDLTSAKFVSKARDFDEASVLVPTVVTAVSCARIARVAAAASWRLCRHLSCAVQICTIVLGRLFFVVPRPRKKILSSAY